MITGFKRWHKFKRSFPNMGFIPLYLIILSINKRMHYHFCRFQESSNQPRPSTTGKAVRKLSECLPQSHCWTWAEMNNKFTPKVLQIGWNFHKLCIPITALLMPAMPLQCCFEQVRVKCCGSAEPKMNLSVLIQSLPLTP